MTRKIAAFIFLVSVSLVSHIARAGISPEIMKAVEQVYPPAFGQYGLQSGRAPLEIASLRGFVVIEKGGIPAERPRFFINWQDYDYRGVIINFDKNEEITTRRGDIYTYLKTGDVMAVAGIKEFGNTIYLKLISADVYVNNQNEMQKRHSHVTVMLGFKFPKEVLAQGIDAVLAKMATWLRPFSNINDAKIYSAQLAGTAVNTAQTETEKSKDTKDSQIQALEEKIDAARKEIDDAEKELKKAKEKN